MSVLNFLKDRESWILPGVVGTGAYGAGRWWLDEGVLFSIAIAAIIAYSIHWISSREKISKSEEVSRELEREWGDIRNVLSKLHLGDPKIAEMEKRANIAKARIDLLIAESLEDWPDRRNTLERKNEMCFIEFGVAVEDKKGTLTRLQSWSAEKRAAPPGPALGHRTELEAQGLLLDFFRNSEHVKSVHLQPLKGRVDFAIAMMDDVTKRERLHAVEVYSGKRRMGGAEKGTARSKTMPAGHLARKRLRDLGVEDIQEGEIIKEGSEEWIRYVVGPLPDSFILRGEGGLGRIYSRDEEE